MFTDYDRRSLHFRKKTIVLILITLFYVSRGTFPEKVFVSKSFSFSKNSRILREKFSNFCEVVSGKVDIIPSYFCRARFQGKIFSKKVFFSLFPDLEQKIDYWRNSRMFVKTLFYVSGGIFWGQTLFSKLYDIFFHVFRAKNCKIWKKIRIIVEVAFYTSGGTSRCNCFGSLKTYFP